MVRSWRWLFASLALVVLAAGLAFWRYSQRPAPAPKACRLPSSIGELGSICGFRNPEDLEYVASLGVILVSEEGFGGRVLGLRPDDLSSGPVVLWPLEPARTSAGESRVQPPPDADEESCRPPSDSSQLAPHGISALAPREPDAPVRVALVSHTLRNGLLTDAVQLFDLTAGPTPALRWRDCIAYPRDVIGNDVALFDDGSLVATNFAPRSTADQLGRWVLRGALGFETGDVLAWSADRGWAHVPGTRAAIPNGIAAARDGRSFYFADAGRRRVAIVPRGPSGEVVRVRVGGAPNNLTVTSAGMILATVATLSGDIPFLCSIGGRSCRSGWAVWEVDPSSHAAVEILADDGREIATATTALEVDGTLYLGSMADDRVGVYRRR